MSAPEGTDLARVLGGLAAQLHALSHQAADLEQTVSAAFQGQVSMAPDLIREIQTLDRLNQGLEDLAQLSRLLADQTDGAQLTQQQINRIAGTLKLSTTRALLSARQTPDDSTTSTIAASDLHLL